MQLINHVQNLLYRYDCVIIPGFGGFISNTISSRIENETNFYPPYKKLGFNSSLTHNDGLLANEIAAVENISFDQANKKIFTEVQTWQSLLRKGDLTFDNIGVFNMHKSNQIVFEPNNQINYLASSFGLDSYSNKTIHRGESNLSKVSNERKGVSTFAKYAATAAILLTLGSLGWKGYEQQQLKAEYAKQQDKLQSKIQSATFVIDNPLPTIELNLTKEINKPYHVVAGAFQFENNANKKVTQLKAKGYNAYILGKNKWGLTQVAYDSYADKYEAYKNLNAIRKADSKDAWLLIKTLQ